MQGKQQVSAPIGSGRSICTSYTDRLSRKDPMDIRTVQLSSVPRKRRIALEKLEAQKASFADHHMGMDKFLLEEAP